MSLALVELIDSSGYLPKNYFEQASIIFSKNSSAKASRPHKKITKPELEKLIKLLQNNIEPCGIFAKNLEESISLQLKDSGKYCHFTAEIINNIQLVASGKYDQLMQKLALTKNELAYYLRLIRSVNPKPLRLIDDEKIMANNVDLIISQEEETFNIKINHWSLPKISINAELFMLLRKNMKQDKRSLKKSNTHEFKALYDQAKMIKIALENRSELLLMVASFILAKQEDFFKYGIMHLKPMKLADVASTIGVHISTISRIVNNKYLDFNGKIFQLKYFFSSSSVKGGDSESQSNKKAMAILQEIISGEEANSIFNDDELALQMKKFGFDLARRTIVKYRAKLAIPNAKTRKENLQKSILMA